ncbi:DUF3616 domain-containing protein [Massilia sp. RP-1-19]|uniref:DUF3616 domain-containing protein n=1 Tax=Massilia polaris TaxID=2728846 RepID=A0A848HKR9_9BURK|nr:DUF3616 domain-containing protein [Massilia polaris]NML62476.1 DUF3616 domain-containing protein [Massilia polaris]
MHNHTPLTGAAGLVAHLPHSHVEEDFIYRGMCDASAAAALDEHHFVVANDERNQLKVYRRGTPDPVDVVDLAPFLGTKPHKESDLEGAAAIGNRIYWISSHGRNSKGEERERRYRFFATDAHKRRPWVTPVAQPYTGMLEDLIASEELAPYQLSEAAMRSPKSDGAFNIEGLSATPEGDLLIGMRNPAPQGKALVIHLRNPTEVIEGAKARFGQVTELDLAGRAIRSIELVGLAYMIVAGPPGKTGDFALYRWSGDPAEAPLELGHVDFREARPEALFAIPGTHMVQILSDDGGDHCKDIPEKEQTFQSVVVRL